MIVAVPFPASAIREEIRNLKKRKQKINKRIYVYTCIYNRKKTTCSYNCITYRKSIYEPFMLYIERRSSIHCIERFENNIRTRKRTTQRARLYGVKVQFTAMQETNIVNQVEQIPARSSGSSYKGRVITASTGNKTYMLFQFHSRSSISASFLCDEPYSLYFISLSLSFLYLHLVQYNNHRGHRMHIEGMARRVSPQS